MNHNLQALHDLLAENDIREHASEETIRLIRQPFPLVENTDEGFGVASDRFAELMDYELGTDEGEIVRKALEHKRWALQEHFSNLYDWNIV